RGSDRRGRAGGGRERPRGFASQPLSDSARGLRADSASGGATGSRYRRLLSFASRPPAPALGLRPRARLAGIRLSNSECGGGGAAGDPGLEAGRRPIGVRAARPDHGRDLMPVRVLIPSALRALLGRQAELAVEARTVGEALEALTGRYPELRRHLLDDAGSVRSFVNLYRNEEDVRSLEGPATPVKDGDTVSIVPSIAGGSVEGRKADEQEPAPAQAAL